ncbi:30S ribosomal protein S7 [candidate division WWE3 bacterium RIFCSPLOWO2_01_FULL_53_14]|uniref:Small ribosomal subunit protein uS7 n=1 Tax=candidate division WWE3 bacterium RIFCSPLOWO2_01_FULL_53_14 TaxID=1802628 RepID=A0A1F4VRD2_UNCKA|nr:MAG: 30S ribosomal protein S7 [candidate division WWE3 bacterium RIFCSPLOWO2_01_FULL_53_14]
MPRGGAIRKRPVESDYRFGSTVVTKFVNQVMMSGRKATAQTAIYGAMDKAAQTLGTEPLLALTQAITNVTPQQEVRSRRVGGATYQIPAPVRTERAQALAIRWIVNAARAKKGLPFAEKLAQEFIAAYNNEGAAVKKKEDVHRMAEANRAFAHFRW